MKSLSLALAVCAVLAASPARADLFYVTGTDANTDGIDDAFTVNGAPAYLVTSVAGGWPVLPDSSITSGKYISWAADQSNATQGNVQGQLYQYLFTFNWAGAATTTTFDFRWVSDDYLSDIVLNGSSLGVNNLAASNPWTISNSRNAVVGNVTSGLNTIAFQVWNTGGQQPPYYGTAGPSGLAADFTVHGDATTPVPEPATMVLVGLGLATGALRRRFRA